MSKNVFPEFRYEKRLKTRKNVSGSTLMILAPSRLRLINICKNTGYHTYFLGKKSDQLLENA